MLKNRIIQEAHTALPPSLPLVHLVGKDDQLVVSSLVLDEVDSLLDVGDKDPAAHGLNIHHHVRQMLVLTLSQHLLLPDVVDPQEMAHSYKKTTLERMHCHWYIIQWSLKGETKEI